MNSSNWQEEIADQIRELEGHAKRMYSPKQWLPYTLVFNLRGKCAGQTKGQYDRASYTCLKYQIRFNKYLSLNNPEEIRNTVIHEYAHYVCDCLYVYPAHAHHDIRWKSVDQALGGDGQTHHRMQSEKKISNRNGFYNLPDPMTRDDAREKGMTLYWSGIPCEAGHQAPRYVRDNVCKECYKIKRRK